MITKMENKYIISELTRGKGFLYAKLTVVQMLENCPAFY